MYKIKVLDKRGKVVARPTQTFTSFDAIEDFMDEKYPKHIYVSDFAKGNPAKHHYEVLVGDTSVYRSTYHETSVGKRQAVSIYNDAIKKSKEGTGWQSGQDVLLLQDEKPVRKFVGYYGNPARRMKVKGWIPAKAIRFRKDGGVDIKTPNKNNPWWSKYEPGYVPRARGTSSTKSKSSSSGSRGQYTRPLRGAVGSLAGTQDWYLVMGARGKEIAVRKRDLKGRPPTQGPFESKDQAMNERLIR